MERTFALCLPAALLLGVAIAAPAAQAQANKPAQDSPYGGMVVEDIIARVNDQIITKSDYDRALKEMDDEARQRGQSMQQMTDQHQDLLRNLIDQQLWISKGKELGITGETELVKQLDEIRKKYNLATIEDLEKAAKEQGVSFEDFKANIRNQIITQEVMRDEVQRKVAFTPGEAQRYFEAHKQDYVQPESVKLSEILVGTGDTPDANKLAAAKAKADDIEAKLKSGGDFDQIARSMSDGPTAAEGGDLGKFQRGGLAKVLEDATFSLKAGEFTDPIRTRQGYVILKVVDHVAGGVPPFKDVQDQVDENFYMSRMEPAIRQYLTKLRENSFIDIRPGYVDSGASARETKPVFSSYTPPARKKKKKVERTRFRETERGASKKPKVVPVSADTTPARTTKSGKSTVQKAGRKEKIRFGQAPRETLPTASNTSTAVEDAGALPKTDAQNEEAAAANEPAAPAVKKTRYSTRALAPKQKKSKAILLDSFAPTAPDAAEVADRDTQSAPLGLGGDTAKQKKKKKTSDGTKQEKKRMQQEKTVKAPTQPVEMIPTPQVTGAPAPATAPAATAPTAAAPTTQPTTQPTTPADPQ